MPLLVTPAQLENRAELYHQLGQLTTAGIGLIPALQMMQRHPPRASMRTPLAELIHQLSAGHTFSDAMPRSGTWISPFDVALLQAGDQSGRLPDCFKLLSAHYHERAQLVRTALASLAYPVFVLHIALLLFPIPRFTGLILQGEVFPFLLQKLSVFAPLYGGAALLILAGNAGGENWRATLEQLLQRVPLLGTARRNLALARLSAALEALISAGVTIIEAWELAATASGSPGLRRFVRRVKPLWLAGQTPAESVSASGIFPDEFSSLYHTGEVSGKLDESLLRARVYFAEQGARKLKTFVMLACGALIGAVMLLVAWQVISFYIGYFQMIDDGTKMAP